MDTKTSVEPLTSSAEDPQLCKRRVPVRVCTFNVENLFARYSFKDDKRQKSSNSSHRAGQIFTRNQLHLNVFDDQHKFLSGKVIQDIDADILCLQEVESLHVVNLFNRQFLRGMKYDYSVMIESHDPRFINVGLLSKYPTDCIRTFKDLKDETNHYIFSRDCLEVTVNVEGIPLTVYINHFKAMNRGRDQTRPARVRQAETVVNIIDERWKPCDYRGNFIVLGDMNDKNDEDTALFPLLEHPHLVNVVGTRLELDDQWTHYFASGDSYQQLDYLLLSKYLADRNTNPPHICRKGMPRRAVKYTGLRFSSVGQNYPKASDHAPVFMDLMLCDPKKDNKKFDPKLYDSINLPISCPPSPRDHLHSGSDEFNEEVSLEPPLLQRPLTYSDAVKVNQVGMLVVMPQSDSDTDDVEKDIYVNEDVMTGC